MVNSVQTDRGDRNYGGICKHDDQRSHWTVFLLKGKLIDNYQQMQYMITVPLGGFIQIFLPFVF